MRADGQSCQSGIDARLYVLVGGVLSTRSDLIVPVGQLCKDYALGKVTKVIVGG